MNLNPLFQRFLSPKHAERADVYTRLMRADKPIGTLLLLWPTYWALWVAADGTPPFYLLVLFTFGTFLMRSAGCVMNDYADRNFDGAVERTQNRPFARGEVSKAEAMKLVAVLCVLAAVCLLPMNGLAWLMSLPALFLALTYPFTKRFFPIPQFYLGLAFSFGMVMAFAAVQNQVPALVWLMFAANACWTLAYDTIYAMADKEDDLKIGIQTSAITFGRYDAEISMAFHAAFTVLMLILGLNIDATLPYYLAAAWVIYEQIKQYGRIKTRNRQACFQTFLQNNRIGWIWFLGIVLHYWWR
ncbi:MAG: 4-hydroxybenzoate octaprenyltransferase [Neisseria sp.]|nr:4-hydroxybenzoate octaprenyltransferase [Neisseria sp.]